MTAVSAIMVLHVKWKVIKKDFVSILTISKGKVVVEIMMISQIKQNVIMKKIMNILKKRHKGMLRETVGRQTKKSDVV
jgi:hypothetical protein